MTQQSVQPDTFVPHRAVIQPSKEALREPSRQGYEILHWGFTALPVLMGLDKFAHLMTNWDAYLSPAFASLSPFGAHTTMLIVGVIEILAGLFVALKPRIAAWVVAAWLLAIIVNLALLGHAWDIALRDFGLMLGAIALARLAQAQEQRQIP